MSVLWCMEWFFFFKQKTAYEMRISDWSSDVCSSDLLFIGAFTRSAQTAYALSNLGRRGGAVTVLGGPHARCYPQDAAKYFDYVLGFNDKPLIADLLSDPARQRPLGVQLKAARQPAAMPNLRARWKFVEANLAKARSEEHTSELQPL